MDANALIIGLSVGALVGAGLAYAWAQARGSSARAALEERLASRDQELVREREQAQKTADDLARLSAELSNLNATMAGLKERLRAEEENARRLADAEERFKQAFEAVSSKVLRTSSQSFLTLANEHLGKFQQGAQADLEKRQKAVDDLVKPIHEALKKVDTKIDQVEKTRTEAYGSLTQHLQSMSESQKMLRDETSNLVRALRRPTVRGQWGEIQLRRVVEMAGMVEYCDFVTQETLGSGEGRLRPDLIVRMPNEHSVVVDSKAPLEHYLNAIEAPDDEARERSMEAHAAGVRDHVKKLSAKSYWDQLESTPEFVVLFLPGENFFSAAVEHDPYLIEFAVDRRVLLATPTTLIALLRTVAYGWRQEQLAENAREISALGKDLFERLRTMAGHFTGLRKGLERAVSSYNKAVGSLESRVLPQARRFKDLGAGVGDDIQSLEALDSTPRHLTATEMERALPPGPVTGAEEREESLPFGDAEPEEDESTVHDEGVDSDSSGRVIEA
jgi:DNA recombination protein RmuC